MRLKRLLIILFLVGFLPQTFADDSDLKEGPFAVLARYGENLTEQARDGSLRRAVGRDAELDRLISRIEPGGDKASALLVGLAGVGKTALVHELAQRVFEGHESTKLLANYTFFTLDLDLLVSESKVKGGVEACVSEIVGALKELRKMGLEGVIFIDEMHQATNVGVDLASAKGTILEALKPYITGPERLLVIGATTYEEDARHLRAGPLERRFERVHITPPNRNALISMISSASKELLKQSGVTIGNEQEVYSAVVMLAQLFSPRNSSPDRDKDLLEQTIKRVSKESKGSYPISLKKWIVEAQGLKERIVRLQNNSEHGAVLEELKKKLTQIEKDIELGTSRITIGLKLLEETHKLTQKIEDGLRELRTSTTQKNNAYDELAKLKEQLDAKQKELQQIRLEGYLRNEVTVQDVLWTVAAKLDTTPEKLQVQISRDVEKYLEEPLSKLVNKRTTSAIIEGFQNRIAELDDKAKEGERRPRAVFVAYGKNERDAQLVAESIAETYLTSRKYTSKISFEIGTNRQRNFWGTTSGYQGMHDQSEAEKTLGADASTVVLLNSWLQSEEAYRLIEGLDAGQVDANNGRKIDFSNKILVFYVDEREMLAIDPKFVDRTLEEQQNTIEEFISKNYEKLGANAYIPCTVDLSSNARIRVDNLLARKLRLYRDSDRILNVQFSDEAKELFAELTDGLSFNELENFYERWVTRKLRPRLNTAKTGSAAIIDVDDEDKRAFKISLRDKAEPTGLKKLGGTGTIPSKEKMFPLTYSCDDAAAALADPAIEGQI